MSLYKIQVMEQAWADFKIKKRFGVYKDWTFAQSLYHAHRRVKGFANAQNVYIVKAYIDNNILI